MNDLLLPPGTRLLHIGPHKTGTTALQIALGKNRDALLRQGVRYIWGGEHLNANLAALAVAKRPTRRFSSAKPVPIEHWTSLVEKANLASADERVIISGEEFCSAQEPTIEKIVHDLNPSKLQIVITLRSIDKIFASQWQQYVQAGAVTKSLDEWLRSALGNETDIENIRRFWVRHRHDQLVKRWARAVGKDRVTVVALDESNREHLYSTFEQMLGLMKGSIRAEDRLVNRSMTLFEAEAVRSMYSLLKDQGIGELADHVRFMISPSELIKRHRKPQQNEPRIKIPEWARGQVHKLGVDMISEIRGIGVRIVGNLESIVPPEKSDGKSNNSPQSEGHATTIPVDLAGWTAYGVIVSSGISRGDLPPAPTSTLPFVWLRRATGSQLMREVMRRVRIRLLQPFSRLRSEKKKGDGL
ncbi:MAG: hypothetical protein ACO25O_04085 [Candidatus Limnocylindrus sp.]